MKKALLVAALFLSLAPIAAAKQITFDGGWLGSYTVEGEEARAVAADIFYDSDAGAYMVKTEEGEDGRYWLFRLPAFDYDNELLALMKKNIVGREYAIIYQGDLDSYNGVTIITAYVLPKEDQR